jgi:hypothetical protein
MGPPPSVPPERVTLALNVDAVAIDRLPADRVIGASLVTLFAESEFDWLCVMGFETAMVMLTSSLGPGTWPLDQLVAVSQSPPLGFIHETEESTKRLSRISSQGRWLAQRLRRRRRGKPLRSAERVLFCRSLWYCGHIAVSLVSVWIVVPDAAVQAVARLFPESRRPLGSVRRLQAVGICS